MSCSHCGQRPPENLTKRVGKIMLCLPCLMLAEAAIGTFKRLRTKRRHP